jgi:hypothetical protein
MIYLSRSDKQFVFLSRRSAAVVLLNNIVKKLVCQQADDFVYSGITLFE